MATFGALSSEPLSSRSTPTISNRASTSQTEESQMSGSRTSPDEPATVAGEGLNKYIPLGCLLLPREPCDHVSPDANAVDAGWAEIGPSHVYPGTGQHVNLDTPTAKLLRAGWIRLFCRNLEEGLLCRIYLLPQDVCRGSIDRKSSMLRSALSKLLVSVDVSSSSWEGCWPSGERMPFDLNPGGDEYSMFYHFNALPSPSPNPTRIRDGFTRRAAEEFLGSTTSSHASASADEITVSGLKSKLYPYQARSAALMIERETEWGLLLDPRLEERRAPDRSVYYYSAHNAAFLKEPRYYETNRGGILAETMGYGKTVICLAVIIATKYHLPAIPPPYQPSPPTRGKVGSLASMAAATISRHSLPWRAFFARREEEEGEFNPVCVQELQSIIPEYEIPVEPVRFNRRTATPPPRRMVLCSGTLIVVPRNLLHQWESEIEKHLVDDFLKVLVMDSPKDQLPPAMELAAYDIVLFSRTRFELEIKDGSDEQGRRTPQGPTPPCRCSYRGSSRDPDCHCMATSNIYSSPLKELHWLRLIVDEGHSFSSATSNAVLVSKSIEAERRWIVSGTPAPGMLGVELDLSTRYAGERTVTEEASFRSSILDERKNFDQKEDIKAAKHLGSLLTHYLKVQPWADSTATGRSRWEDYVFKQGMTGFTSCLGRTLEASVVKTRPEDVERDIRLPKMTHKVVYLEPSFYDKMSANMFIQVLRANAITSERTDADYLFHKNNIKARHDLIRNLRQSNFAWTGFSEENVLNSVEISRKYLEQATISCSPDDRHSLTESTNVVETLLNAPGWLALSRSHEIGFFIDGWPASSFESWSMDSRSDPMLVGITQLLKAQDYVNRHLSLPDPSEGLAELGSEVMQEMLEVRAIDDVAKKIAASTALDSLAKTGVPTTCLHGERNTNKSYAAITKKISPRHTSNATAAAKTEDSTAESPSHTKKRKPPIDLSHDLPETSPLKRTSVLGTTSAKLSYLMDKVRMHQHEEKILIFYDGDNPAYYLAQGLELLHVKHLIYARTLSNAQRSKYVVAFNEDPSIRVLLIDVGCGALGLNLNIASVVLIVNPINRPNIEAQAIKRAHRIGQTREVLVETLVLKGTIEEAIFERAKRMTRNEHVKAKELEDDDKIQSIIQQARIIPVAPSEGDGYAQMAQLRAPQPVFGREGRGDGKIAGIDLDEPQSPAAPKRKRAPRDPTTAPRKRPSRAKGTGNRVSAGTTREDATAGASDPAAAPSTPAPLPSSLFGGSFDGAFDGAFDTATSTADPSTPVDGGVVRLGSPLSSPDSGPTNGLLDGLMAAALGQGV